VSGFVLAVRSTFLVGDSARRLDAAPRAAEGRRMTSMSAALGCGGSSKPAAKPEPEPEPSKGLAVGEPDATKPDPADVAPPVAEDPDDENSPRVKSAMALLAEEDLGGLKPGLDAKAAEKILGKASKKGKPVMEEATGESVATWEWKKAGVSIVFSDAKKKPVARNITLTAGAKLKTKAGVGIGSTLEELDAAYAAVRRPADGDGDAEALYRIGTMYVGMVFELKDRAVTLVTWGTLAE
jgi:hypothetical protein